MCWECTLNSLCKKDVIDTDFRSLGDFICHFMGCSTVEYSVLKKKTQCVLLFLGCRRYFPQFI